MSSMAFAFQITNRRLVALEGRIWDLPSVNSQRVHKTVDRLGNFARTSSTVSMSLVRGISSSIANRILGIRALRLHWPATAWVRTGWRRAGGRRSADGAQSLEHVVICYSDLEAEKCAY